MLYSPGDHSPCHYHWSLRHRLSLWTQTETTISLGGSQPSSLVSGAQAQEGFLLSSVQHVYFSSHFWLHDIISPLHWSISERGLVTSPLAGCRSSTGVRASVSVSWVSHLTACHTRLTSARRQTLHYGIYFFAALLFSAGKEGFEKWIQWMLLMQVMRDHSAIFRFIKPSYIKTSTCSMMVR